MNRGVPRSAGFDVARNRRQGPIARPLGIKSSLLGISRELCELGKTLRVPIGRWFVFIWATAIFRD